jgi:hypothetical protein
VTEELRQGAHRRAAGVDPEAVLAVEDLEVELLDDVVGLLERFQAGVPAVQEAAGVAQQAVAGQFQQPLAGRDVAGNGTLQKPQQDRGRFVVHGPRSLLCGRRVLRSRLPEPGAVVRKNRQRRYPSRRLPPG